MRAALLVLLIQFGASAESDVERVLGIWQGTLPIGAVELRLVLHVELNEDRLISSIDSPDQNAHGIATSRTSFEDGVLRVELDQLGAWFEGTLNESGDELSGIWNQSGQALDLVLRKVDEVEERPRPQNPEAPFPYREEKVRFDGPTGTLGGTLTIPDGDGPFPAVVMVSGSGPQDRDESLMGHRPFWVLADHLARHGIASLRYDDRGVGESQGDFRGSVTLDFANDATAATQWMHEQGFARVGILGHSEGGLIAPLVAGMDSELAFAVILAGPAISGRELMPRQLALIGAVEGLNEEEVLQAIEINSTLYGMVNQPGSREEIEVKLREYLAAKRDELAPAMVERLSLVESAEDNYVSSLLDPWFRQFLIYDPAPDLRKMRIPVLALYGSLDLQVPPAATMKQMERAIAQSHELSRVIVFDGLNHLFQPATTGSVAEYAQIEITIDPEVLQTIHEWILQLPE